MKYTLLIWNNFIEENTLFLLPENDVLSALAKSVHGKYINEENFSEDEESLDQLHEALFDVTNYAPNPAYVITMPYTNDKEITSIVEAGFIP